MRGDEVTIRAEVKLVIDPEALVAAFDRLVYGADNALIDINTIKRVIRGNGTHLYSQFKTYDIGNDEEQEKYIRHEVVKHLAMEVAERLPIEVTKETTPFGYRRQSA